MATAEKPKATKSEKPKKNSPPSSEPGTGDRIIEGFEKSAGAQALDRTVVLDLRVARLERAMEAAARGNYAIKKALRDLDGE